MAPLIKNVKGHAVHLTFKAKPLKYNGLPGNFNLASRYLNVKKGSGGGTSGRAIAFCLGRPGLNPVRELEFFNSELLSIFSHWVAGFF